MKDVAILTLKFTVIHAGNLSPSPQLLSLPLLRKLSRLKQGLACSYPPCNRCITSRLGHKCFCNIVCLCTGKGACNSFPTSSCLARCKLLSSHSQARTCFKPPPLYQALPISPLPPAVPAGPPQADQMSVCQEWLQCQLRDPAYLLSKVTQTCGIPQLQPVSSFPQPHNRP